MTLKEAAAQLGVTPDHHVEKARARGQRISRQPWKAYHMDRPLGIFVNRAAALEAIQSCRWCEA